MVLTLAALAGSGVVTAAEIMTPLESARALAPGMRTTRPKVSDTDKNLQKCDLDHLISAN